MIKRVDVDGWTSLCFRRWEEARAAEAEEDPCHSEGGCGDPECCFTAAAPAVKSPYVMNKKDEEPPPF